MPVIKYKGATYLVTAEQVYGEHVQPSRDPVRYVGVWQQLDTATGSSTQMTASEFGQEQDAIAAAIQELKT